MIHAYTYKIVCVCFKVWGWHFVLGSFHNFSSFKYYSAKNGVHFKFRYKKKYNGILHATITKQINLFCFRREYQILKASRSPDTPIYNQP